MFVYSSVCLDCFIFICGCLCCRLGCLSTSGVLVTRIYGVDIKNFSIHVPWCIYHPGVRLHQTNTESIWISWIWRVLAWPHMLSTVMHVHSWRSAFTLDGSDTVPARWDICRSGCFSSLATCRPSQTSMWEFTYSDDLRWDQQPLCALSWSCAGRSIVEALCYSECGGGAEIHQMVLSHLTSTHDSSRRGCLGPEATRAGGPWWYC